MELKKIIKKNYIIFITISMISTQAFSSLITDSSWDNLLTLHNFPANNQAYCYTDEFYIAQGKNLNLRVRLASVSKLLTSLWAIEKLGINYKYETKLFIKGNNLHIEGSSDPFLGNEKMFFLISQLNDLGYTKFTTITFNDAIQINPDAEVQSDQYPVINRDSNAYNLKMYFNTKNWSPRFRAEYNRIANIAKGRLRPNVLFEIENVQYVDSNPYKNDIEAKMLTLSSPELYKYLKEINVQSNNYAAHTLFLNLGGETEFEKFLSDYFNKTSDSIHLYTGSGLPSIVNGVRYDNYATCAIVIELIAALKFSAEDQGYELKDIVAVPGSDAGTFSNRIFPSDYKNSFVAKTGTLMHTSALAGAMSTKKEFSFYGLFNQTSDIIGAKIIQNEMMVSLMTEMGGPLAFNYVVIPFHTYNNENVKRMYELFNGNNNSTEFMPFSDDLF